MGHSAHTAYKLSAVVLDEKLRRETEEKELFPDGTSMVSSKQIYHEYIRPESFSTKRKGKEGEGVSSRYIFIINFKVAFDTLGSRKTRKLWREIEESKRSARQNKGYVEKRIQRRRIA